LCLINVTKITRLISISVSEISIISCHLLSSAVSSCYNVSFIVAVQLGQCTDQFYKENTMDI
jgi:hypothetical protein